MVKVYFETKTDAKLVAIFNNEDLYNECKRQIEIYGLLSDYDTVTESVDDLPLEDVFKKDIKKLRDELIEKLDREPDNQMQSYLSGKIAAINDLLKLEQ